MSEESSENTKKINLSLDQEEIIRLFWDKIALTELTQKVFARTDIDGRSAQGRAIR